MWSVTDTVYLAFTCAGNYLIMNRYLNTDLLCNTDFTAIPALAFPAFHIRFSATFYDDIANFCTWFKLHRYADIRILISNFYTCVFRTFFFLCICLRIQGITIVCTFCQEYILPGPSTRPEASTSSTASFPAWSPTPSWSTPPRHKNRPARFLRERGIAVPGWGKREARRPPGSPGLRATRPGHGGMWACRPTRFGGGAAGNATLSGRP